MSINDINKDARYLYLVLTDEKQALYITHDATEAYLVKDEWEAEHAAEAELIEFTGTTAHPHLKGWTPDIPPMAEVEFNNIKDIKDGD